METTTLRRGWAAVLLAMLVPMMAGAAAGQSYSLLGGLPAALNHYPGPDGLVLSGDDAVSAQITNTVGSDPNFQGDLSYASGVTFPPGDADLPLTLLSMPDPLNYDGIAFLEGAVTLDPTVAAAVSAINQPLVSAISATATAFRQGLGVGSLSFTAVLSGSYDPVGHTAAENVDLRLSNAWISQDVSGVDLSGSAFVVPSSDFGAFNANTYVQNEVIPRAQAAGAAGVVFIQLRGVLPQTLPFVFFDTPVLLNLVGLLDAAPANSADLMAEKTFTGAPTLTPGDTVVYNLAVKNEGAGAAANVALVDRIPDRATWDSDTCGAGPPAGGLLTWNIGALVDQASVSCDVTVVLDADANFDQENGATVLSDTFDPDLSNNTAKVVVSDIVGAEEGLAQLPDQSTGFQSDAACGSCPSGSQALAENFRVSDERRITEIAWHGAYTDNTPFADRFTVEIHANAVTVAPGLPGAPGDLVAAITAPVRRRPTGLMVAGRTEFEYRVTANLILPRGVYWVVIYNDSSAGSGDWFWESASQDGAMRSVSGLASNVAVPLTPFWATSTTAVVALQITTAPPAGAMAPVVGFRVLLLLAALLAMVGWWRAGPDRQVLSPGVSHPAARRWQGRR